MKIDVIGRHTDVNDRFREHAERKLAKAEQYDSRAQRIDVVLTHESNPRQTESAERVEITVHGKGPVVRSEASAGDRYGAFDLALGKLLERMRRDHDRRKSRHKSQRRAGGSVDLGTWEPAPDLLESDADADAGSAADADGAFEFDAEAAEALVAAVDGADDGPDFGVSPVVVREKVHTAVPMTVEQAMTEMELVGHDFYLFIDAETHDPAVLYHRHGWTYGVIRLQAPATPPVD